jgi:hypothetical protein
MAQRELGAGPLGASVQGWSDGDVVTSAVVPSFVGWLSMAWCVGSQGFCQSG